MLSLDIIRRLRAYHAGYPIPFGETKRYYVADDAQILAIAFVRMGGESRPWAIAFGRPDREPRVVTVPEARNRDLVAEMALELAPVLLQQLQCPSHCKSNLTEWGDLPPLRQLWLPNDTHLDMLHHLAFAYTWTKHSGVDQKTLNALGRACGWLFRESQRPGQQVVLLATQVLRELFTFPTETVRQNHLGYLLAWLEGRGGYEARLAAATEAEQYSTSTSLDPQVEREVLEPLVEAWGQAEKKGTSAPAKQAKRKIAAALELEVTRRWYLVQRAIQVVRKDKRIANAGLDELVKEALKEQWYQYNRVELNLDDPDNGPAFVPSVETDRHPAAAASRYLVHQASAELLEGLLVHNDRELLANAIAAGDAFRGKIISVRDEGEGRVTTPIWRISDPADRQLRLRAGSVVEAVGFKRRQGVIRAIDDAVGGGFEIEIELTNCKTNRNPGPGIHAQPPTERSLRNKVVAFVASSGEGISRRKASRVWNKDGPGAWLTHGRPGAGHVVTEDDRDDAAVVEASLQRAGGSSE